MNDFLFVKPGKAPNGPMDEAAVAAAANSSVFFHFTGFVRPGNAIDKLDGCWRFCGCATQQRRASKASRAVQTKKRKKKKDVALSF